MPEIVGDLNLEQWETELVEGWKKTEGAPKDCEKFTWQEWVQMGNFLTGRLHWLYCKLMEFDEERTRASIMTFEKARVLFNVAQIVKKNMPPRDVSYQDLHELVWKNSSAALEKAWEIEYKDHREQRRGAKSGTPVPVVASPASRYGRTSTTTTAAAVNVNATDNSGSGSSSGSAGDITRVRKNLNNRVTGGPAPRKNPIVKKPDADGNGGDEDRKGVAVEYSRDGRPRVVPARYRDDSPLHSASRPSPQGSASKSRGSGGPPPAAAVIANGNKKDQMVDFFDDEFDDEDGGEGGDDDFDDFDESSSSGGGGGTSLKRQSSEPNGFGFGIKRVKMVKGDNPKVYVSERLKEVMERTRKEIEDGRVEVGLCLGDVVEMMDVIERMEGVLSWRMDG
ncbi:hypothetical protein HDU76_003244 [Blyttiomyces sp. JEL0837]|nr:hypothetical protein HDU76_003244 [Blyttiomyces sp. JEL0837]